MGAPKLREAEDWTRTSCTLPDRVWTRLDKALDAFNLPRDKPEKYTRDRFMAELLDWACEELEAERAERGSEKKGR